MVDCRIVNIDRCSLNDGEGIRTVIFFKGCNLRCVWCHNPETYSFEIQDYYENEEKKQFGYNISTDEIKEIILKDLNYYKNSKGGVTLSGGEALLQINAVEELAKFCFENNISINVETSGYVPLGYIQRIEKYVDYWMYDYKLSDQSLYRKYINGDYKLIMDNLHYLIQKKAKIILRCPIIPTINDTYEHFQHITNYSKYVQEVDILPYHNLGKTKADKLGIKDYFAESNVNEKNKNVWRQILIKQNCENFQIK